MIQDRLKIRVWDKRKNNYIEDFVFNFINHLNHDLTSNPYK